MPGRDVDNPSLRTCLQRLIKTWQERRAPFKLVSISAVHCSSGMCDRLANVCPPHSLIYRCANRIQNTASRQPAATDTGCRKDVPSLRFLRRLINLLPRLPVGTTLAPCEASPSAIVLPTRKFLRSRTRLNRYRSPFVSQVAPDTTAAFLPRQCFQISLSRVSLLRDQPSDHWARSATTRAGPDPDRRDIRRAACKVRCIRGSFSRFSCTPSPAPWAPDRSAFIFSSDRLR